MDGTGDVRKSDAKVGKASTPNVGITFHKGKRKEKRCGYRW
jgi:hypothetical protein